MVVLDPLTHRITTHLLRGAEWLSERLRNEDDEYPWQTVRWPFGVAYFALLPFAALLSEGLELALAGFALGMATLVFMALLAWKWPV